MVNFQFNLASVSGIILAVGGAALYAVRSARPELSRDHDIFFSAVGLLCGLILIFYGWRFDPIMQFGQVLLTGAAIFFVVENLRLRRVSTEQAKKNTPIVDRERPVSKRYDTYDARFEDQEVINDRVSRPRIQGSRNERTSRDEYDDRPARRPTTRRNSDTRLDSIDRPRRQSRTDEPIIDTTSESSSYSTSWGAENRTDDRPSPSRSQSSRPRRPRTDEGSSRRNGPERPSDDYVDYRPIESNDNESDNWGNG
ncbi:MAG: hypothetical protein HC780_20305 [Leptolyngbyaceae cyanobacterium CSU_1_3]|nr:hypothetical protein [Leptolyngbyaceae cyanobacterium CSU_1_3]